MKLHSGPSKASIIYVVDDEKIIAATLATILQNHGFDARAFNSAEEVLGDRGKDFPSLLITDVMMTCMNGIDLAVHFKTRFPQCSVLLFSGNLATAGLLESAKANGHDFMIVAKPVHPNEILAKVSALLAQAAQPARI